MAREDVQLSESTKPQIEDLRKSEAFALASGLYRGAVHISGFIASSVRHWVDGYELKDDCSAVLVGQLLRVDSWLRTLAKLNDPADFQAVAGAARALLETTIDIALIHANPQDHERLLAWEDSAKLKHSELAAQYLVTNNVQGTQKHIVAFAAANKARIDALRTNLGWIKKKDGSPRHPERWTNHPLDVDARQVDTLGHSFKFEEFYETEYRKVCWSVHGSGFVMRSIQTDAFPSLAGLLFPPCISLALLSSELVLQHLGLWGADQKKQFSFAKVQHAQIVEQTRRATLSLPSEPPPGSGTGTV